MDAINSLITIVAGAGGLVGVCLVWSWAKSKFKPQSAEQAAAVQRQTDRLIEYLKKPEVHGFILNGYTGDDYSLGVTKKGGKLAVRLCVVARTVTFPSHIDVDGIRVPIVVNSNWTVPSPLRKTTDAKLEKEDR